MILHAEQLYLSANRYHSNLRNCSIYFGDDERSTDYAPLPRKCRVLYAVEAFERSIVEIGEV
jgi:hypothetical protein